MLDAKLRLIEVTSPPGPLHCDLIHCLTEPTGLRSARLPPARTERARCRSPLTSFVPRPL